MWSLGFLWLGWYWVVLFLLGLGGHCVVYVVYNRMMYSMQEILCLMDGWMICGDFKVDTRFTHC